MLVMLVIDITAGPLLTLVVYKPGKPSLRFDLSVIALVQAAFLAYGLHTLWQSRPVFLVGSDVRFNLVMASEVDPAQLAKAPRPEWRTLSSTGPVLVGVLPPADQQQRRSLLDILLETGRDQEQLPEQYRPYDEVRSLVLAKSVPLEGRADAGDYRAVPIISRFDEAWMLVDSKGNPHKVIPRR
ncbi:hypothetical protein H1235_04010 [Pseudoxanthomonas sp. NC8]|nr:hypothetical protein H1235_04010 [Pseudoxanthomonas sp. NC8]